MCVCVLVIERGSTMIEVSYTVDGWEVTYRMDGVRCVSVVCRDVDFAMNEIRSKLMLMRGLFQGKTWAVKEGNEI